MNDNNKFGLVYVVLVLSVVLSIVGLVSAISKVGLIDDRLSSVTSIVGGGEWVCIAEECKEWISGEDWANSYCKLKDGFMGCELEIDKKSYIIPMDQLNLSAMRGCKVKECVTQVYVKQFGGK